jgi:hypothetical protein
MVKRRIAMSEIPDDIWKAAEAAAKMIITADELKVNSYRVYDAAIVIANAILAERQRCAAIARRLEEETCYPESATAGWIADAILSPAEKEAK